MKKNFEKAVLKYFAKLKEDSNVLGILLTGSAGRGDMDIFSDVDNVILVDSYKKNLKEGKIKANGFTFDTRITRYCDLNDINLNKDVYFAYLNASVLYDRQNKTRALLSRIKNCWLKDRKKFLILTLVNLSVIFEFSDNWHGLKNDSHFKKFINRGDFASALRVLNAGYEGLLDLLYLVNQQPIPDEKNKIRLINQLNWQPQGLKTILSETLITEKLDNETLKKRYQKLYRFMRRMTEFLDKNLSLPKNLYNYYLLNRRAS